MHELLFVKRPPMTLDKRTSKDMELLFPYIMKHRKSLNILLKVLVDQKYSSVIFCPKKEWRITKLILCDNDFFSP